MSRGLGDVYKRQVVSTLWKYDEVGTNVEATNEQKILLSGTGGFDTPKPTRLIERVIKIATDKDSIVLDSFAGSGTTVLAAVKEGYDAIGIEVTDVYADLARKRLESELNAA